MYVYVCACISAAGRQGYPPKPGSALPRIRSRGRCSHRPGNLAMSQGSTAGVNARPTIQGKREVEPRTADRRPLGRGRSLHRPAVGPDVRLLILCCRPHAGALWGGRFRPPQTRLPPQTSPAGVNARREGSRPPGRVLARQGAAPLSRLTPTLPVCGARIMRRMLKRACILRPPHLLRLAVSAAGGARLRSPLQGSKASPARGGGCAARRRRRGALPLCGGNIL